MFFVLLISGSAVYGQTHIYERYATHSNLEVAYIEGFALDSVTRVNVTILRAKNDRAWRWMQKEFNIEPLSGISEEYVRLHKKIVDFCLRDSDDLRNFSQGDLTSKCVLSISWETQTIAFYHIASHKEYQAIIFHIVDKIIVKKDHESN